MGMVGTRHNYEPSPGWCMTPYRRNRGSQLRASYLLVILCQRKRDVNIAFQISVVAYKLECPARQVRIRSSALRPQIGRQRCGHGTEGRSILDSNPRSHTRRMMLVEKPAFRHSSDEKTGRSRSPLMLVIFGGGAKGDRTPDLMTARLGLQHL